jgi:hypothetical protein
MHYFNAKCSTPFYSYLYAFLARSVYSNIALLGCFEEKSFCIDKCINKNKMPNICNNTLRVSGPVAAMQQFRLITIDNQEDREFDPEVITSSNNWGTRIFDIYTQIINPN